MPKANPLAPLVDPMAVLREMYDDGDWWDYVSGGDDTNPCEPKPEDWGILNGELVVVDYAAPALSNP